VSDDETIATQARSILSSNLSSIGYCVPTPKKTSKSSLTLINSLRQEARRCCDRTCRGDQISKRELDIQERDLRTAEKVEYDTDDYAEGDDESIEDDEAEQNCVKHGALIYDRHTRNVRSGDHELKQIAFQESVMELSSYNCPQSQCPNNGACCHIVNLAQVKHLREHYWGPAATPAPTSTERRGKIYKLLERFYQPSSNRFGFALESNTSGGDLKKPQVVCEHAYMRLLGYRGVSRQWKQCKVAVRHRTGGDAHRRAIDKAAPLRSRAAAWISRFSDRCADTMLDGGGNVKVLPYETVADFFKEYKASAPNHSPNQPLCTKRTFSRALDWLNSS
jgi:hypothetical protein